MRSILEFLRRLMMMKTQMMIADKVTSNGGSEEKVAKSRGPSEGDGGRRKDVEGVHDEQGQAAHILGRVGVFFFCC